MKRRKISYIGSSYKFVHQSIRDYLLSGKMNNTDIFLYDIDPIPLKLEYDLITKMINQVNSSMTVTMAKNRKNALDGADYVIVSVLVGGMDLAEKEDLICQKYKIRHTVGDTVGPMFIARCLRMVPLLIDIAKDMERYCPTAIMLNVTNPMSVLTNAVNRNTKINCIGICHGTHFRIEAIAKVYSVEEKEVALNLVGVNHLAFINKISIKGEEKDLKQVAHDIKEIAKKGHEDVAGYQDTDIWANEFACRLGIIPNNGDHHFIEFFSWFLGAHAFDTDGKNIYGLDHMLHSAEARRERCRTVKDLISKWAYEDDPIPNMDTYSGERLHEIILGIEGIHGDECNREFHINVTNNRAVPNLPPEANLELTSFLTANGALPLINDPVDPLILGFITPLVCLNLLTEKAAVEKDKQSFLEALHLDPLISDFRTIPQLADELWNVNQAFMLPVK